MPSPQISSHTVTGKTIVNISPIHRNWFSDFFNAIIRKSYCGCQLTPQKWGSGFSNAVIKKTIVDISSHSQGSIFVDLSFQEETIVDRSLRVLYLGKYVNYICNIVSQSVESYLQRSSSFSPLLVFLFPQEDLFIRALNKRGRSCHH